MNNKFVNEIMADFSKTCQISFPLDITGKGVRKYKTHKPAYV